MAITMSINANGNVNILQNKFHLQWSVMKQNNDMINHIKIVFHSWEATAITGSINLYIQYKFHLQWNVMEQNNDLINHINIVFPSREAAAITGSIIL